MRFSTKMLCGLLWPVLLQRSCVIQSVVFKQPNTFMHLWLILRIGTSLLKVMYGRMINAMDTFSTMCRKASDTKLNHPTEKEIPISRGSHTVHSRSHTRLRNENQTLLLLSFHQKTKYFSSCDIYSINTVAIAPFQHTEKTWLKGAQNMY